MANNIGTTIRTFSRTIGGTTIIPDPLNESLISMISGQLGIGAMIFDETGTMGICTAFTLNANQRYDYSFRTSSLNTEVDIQTLLGQSY